ncbi:hypothetical protein GCM10010218_49800 [Streptomyces mashuensis]|uniref:Integrase n=1 Tax=Streptomyces mashuensis TaxID=33904 RepID=A0A919B6L1_9ACTN|nr:hypothetical protein [Streptomyces mashuensis]GHF62371.1 hypothetical protein GCM10010218_49800 [Streptomyces mashuensis]
MPIRRGLTPHGFRHTSKKIAQSLRTPPKLMDGLTEAWEAALAARRAMCHTSPVRALDVLLRGGR